MNKVYYVYIIGNEKPVLYIGVTNSIDRRLYEHKEGLVEGFSSQYKTCKLLYVEEFTDICEALVREKQLKHWKREWKLELILKTNPKLVDLSTL